MNRSIPLILLGVLLNAFAQLALKQGMRSVGYFAFNAKDLMSAGIKAAFNPFVAAGFFCYAASVIVWLVVLSRVDVSYAYPFLSVGYIVTAIAAHIFFGEPLGIARGAGILVICLGVYLITRSVS